MTTTPVTRRPECPAEATEAPNRCPDRTDAEWERLNLDSALQHLDDAWSALIRAMYRDTRTVPGQYRLVITGLRRDRDDVAAMVEERQ